MTKEIERISMLTKGRYDELLSEFRASFELNSSSNLTSIWYFTDINDEYVKLDSNHTNQTAKLVHKKRNGAEREELEALVSLDEVDGIDLILSSVIKGERYVTQQQRYDFKVGSELLVTLKYTTDMKWHVEIEADSSLERSIAYVAIADFAAKYKLDLLDEEQELALYQKLISDRKQANRA